MKYNFSPEGAKQCDINVMFEISFAPSGLCLFSQYKTQLRRMFSQAKAPFFHFGQNLSFPNFGKEFTDHLAKVYSVVTQRKINSDDLWQAFQKMNKIPQFIRSLVERLVLNPGLKVYAGTKQLIDEVSEDRKFVQLWNELSEIEQEILLAIVAKKTTLFSIQSRKVMAKNIGRKTIEVQEIQSALRTLQRKNIIGSSADRGQYFLDDPSFSKWISLRDQT